MKKTISIFWFRRDLRLEDNAALYHALRGKNPILPIFIFDQNILDKLAKDDARITFIYQTIEDLKKTLHKNGSDLLVKYGKPETVWPEVLKEYDVAEVYTNHDYEPYARERDDNMAEFLRSENIEFKTFKDQVIFEKGEILKADQTPYTVFTPYYKQWHAKLNDFSTKAYPTKKHFKNLLDIKHLPLPSLKEMGFEVSRLQFPKIEYKSKLDDYAKERDFPAVEGTTRIGLHLRFGTISIRKLAKDAIAANSNVWLSELAWREFYMMILWHFPYSASDSFKKQYDKIKWRNDEKEFKAWCEGNTGYPIVDAGMRQLNEIGWMHNRVRMVTASFLSKHLLIDWRWGEAYFANKLLDYEMASNVGGWQWAAGSGNDAAPYFRVFNPELQTKRFDPKFEYIKKWVPEFGTKKYAQPIVEHKFARERVLKVFKEALS
ncbi:deoxyribodipyrimidine photo-lyase [Pedobacter psychrotolerans]|uniref:Deoxyribodipyrimidine photo-lyase n=1 Tax=Pedobacter psychrotolerans TaxID=1843235 RepID=A0A4R2HBG2_9SPHI|nr:deoxyribodipyrimidine photo-lyase [Pedobacter psychrotolerans]TCO23664.1 deoxyribodipyrimidine photo-lyase [Pedobacter psychrotolerans]GGE61672.1 deoxyribodipyrimidine photo-lyase [Pedobacter psychrotolerans]